MAKVNEFEAARYTYETAKQRFSSEANTHYRYPSLEMLLNNIDELSKMIQHHKEHQVPRLVTLADYYKGNNHTILRANRRKEEHLADHRATHNFAKYISQFIQGYMMGVPLKTNYPDDEMSEKLKEINRENDADEHNSDLILDLSIYGRAYELLYRNQLDETRFTLSHVTETFVIYDTTVEMNPIAAVRYVSNQFNNDELEVYLYTDTKIYQYIAKDPQSVKLSYSDERDHYFDGVPIIEYENNKFRQGDFEDVLSLIDLYDEAQSDTSNYMSDLNDAMLKIVGNLEIDVEQAKKMKENNILMLQTEVNADGRSGQADADYIYKKYDVNGTEAYKDRIFNNILLFASIPNLLDEHFSQNQSGEALKMKLFGLSQKRSIKERLFKKSLRDRYRLISNMMKRASEGELDVNEISITFTENLPRAIDQELRWFASLGGELSQETLLSLLSFVDNPKEEMEKIEYENKLNQPVYDFQTAQNEEVNTDGIE